MGQVLAIVSQKGGVGKTTTAINIAAAFARRGTRTLLVDSDPQGSVRLGLGIHGPESRSGFSDFLAGDRQLHEVVQPTEVPWLRVVPVGSVSEHGDHEGYQREFATSPRVSELFARARSLGYLVVVDTPPGLGPIVHRVLGDSQHVVVPLQCEPLALQTTTQMLRGIRDIAARNECLVFEGMLLTMLEQGNAVSERVAAYVREQLPADLVFDVAIPRTFASIDAFAAGQPVVLHSPDDAAAKAYEALVDELTRRFQ